MKNALLILLAAVIVIASAAGLVPKEETAKAEYLRIHIRANSNEDDDQSVKYEVKEKVVGFLTPLIAECDSKEKAMKVIGDNLRNIEKVADRTLRERGYTYSSEARLNNELFPTRVYESLTLDSGYYDALILELGEGAGDNWWCVVYPPLCFVGSGNYVYKSKIKSIIDSFFNN
ncbi:MAG: stage II sporulation protein R [Clostridia bacterium]|nr:stage II sporulation protein R [Clostridia bacterium]